MAAQRVEEDGLYADIGLQGVAGEMISGVVIRCANMAEDL